MQPAVQVKHLSVSYHGQTALQNITFTADSGQLIGIIGPNGAGKSTLIKAIVGLVPFQAEAVRILGKKVAKVRKEIAYVSQRSIIDFDFPVLVEDVVLMGRYPHISWWKPAGKNDRRIALDCLEQVGMTAYRKRQIGELSGGQQQRVFLARALAQQANIFFLDEPFAGIDIKSENIMIRLLRQMRDQGKTLFVVHHDLSKVEDYFDSLLLLNKKMLGFGKNEDVFQAELVSQAYEGNVATLPSNSGIVVVGG
jgi:manganese transport system ATP-binding protein